MARSISRRIFTGFLVLMLAFGGVMGFSVYRMHVVREQLELINRSYLRLTLLCGELYVIQGRMVNRIAEQAAGRGTPALLLHHIKVARRYRLRNVSQALELVRRTEASGGGEDRGQLKHARALLEELRQEFRDDEPLFEQLFSGEQTPVATLARIGENLLRDERKLETLTRKLRSQLRRRLRSAAETVEADQQVGVWAGLLALLTALGVGLMITLRARRTLRPLKTLVASTKRIGSGDYAGRVPVTSRDELGVLADEFNHMAEAVQEREARLIRSERMAAAGLLASHITHEVRNPLNSISLNSEMLEEELAGDEDDESRALCRSIRREVDRLTEITEEYLRFARLPKPNLEQEDLNELASSLLEFVASELKNRGVTVHARLERPLPKILGDENQLRQALLNLLRNAGEAMDETGGELSVSTTSGAGSVSLAIADTGPGIEAEHLAKIFEPFFSTKERGTGLGLALTHQIVTEHGGRIDARSTPGEGTVFTVTLPVSSGTQREDDDA